MLEFDVDDLDGGLFMLDRDFGGTVTVSFSKPMDLSVQGVVTVDGKPVDCTLKHVDQYADRHGIAVIDETAAVGLNLTDF